MTCYSPLKGFKSRELTKNGKRKITFDPKKGYIDMPVTVPCGQCIGCRLDKSRHWAMRCVHEASLYDNNCFLTLTYSDENLPNDLSLDKSHFQKFIRSLRKRNPSTKIRYYHCGEYGDENYRPHYHAAIFNYDFPDKVLWQVKNGNRLYTSDTLNSIWTKGYSIIGDLTFDSAAYIARYVTKKITGEQSIEHYKRVDKETGEIHRVIPEYSTMSRRPGIGKDWYKKYKTDVYPDDFVILNGKKVSIPPFYDKILENEDPDLYHDIKKERKYRALIQVKNGEQTYQRLQTKEVVKKAQTKQLKRNI